MYNNYSLRYEDFEDRKLCSIIGVGAGLLGGGLLSGLLGLGGSAIGAAGASSAASQSAAAQQNALNFQKGVYDTSQGQLQPYYQSGISALQGLNNGITGSNFLTQSPQAFGAQTGQPVPNAPTYSMPNYSISNFQSSPGYQFQLQQGLNAINNSGNPRTGAVSGNTLQSLTQYGTGLANQDWWNWLSNQQNNYNTQYQAQTQEAATGYNEAAQNQSTIYNRLLQMALGGQQAATLTGPQAGLTNTIGNTQAGIGATQAAGTLGTLGSVASAFNPTGTSGTSAIQNALTALTGGGGSTATNPYSLAYAYGSGANGFPGAGTGLPF